MYLLAVIYLAFISLGLPDSLLGSAWSTMQNRAASAYVGSTFMPPVFGLLANYVSIKLLPLYLLIFVILMICMTEKVFRKEGVKEARKH